MSIQSSRGMSFSTTRRALVSVSLLANFIRTPVYTQKRMRKSMRFLINSFIIFSNSTKVNSFLYLFRNTLSCDNATNLRFHIDRLVGTHDVPRCPGPATARDKPLVVIVYDKQYWNRIPCDVSDLCRRINTVHLRHIHVQNDQVRLCPAL